jgi:hypothetical protein
MNPRTYSLLVFSALHRLKNTIKHKLPAAWTPLEEKNFNIITVSI